MLFSAFDSERITWLGERAAPEIVAELRAGASMSGPAAVRPMALPISRRRQPVFPS